MSPLLQTFGSATSRGYRVPSGSEPAYELIATSVLGASATSVFFGSIPSTYQHLEIRMVTKNSSDSGVNTCGIRFNEDAGSTYSSHRLYGDTNGVTADFQQPTWMEVLSVGSQLPSIFSANVVSVLNYKSTSTFKTIRSLNGANASSSNRVSFYSGNWRNTAAINSLRIVLPGTNFVAGSRFSLYGIKG